MKASGDTKVPVKINWEPFFLNHNTPDEGEDLMEHLKNKYGQAAVARFGKHRTLESAFSGFLNTITQYKDF